MNSKAPLRIRRLLAATLVLGALLIASAAEAARIKDLASIGGVRTNQLAGYGLVVGLDGTGDQTSQAPFTSQSLRNMLNQLGITIPPGQNLQLKNVAAVMVSAELPPFSKPGQNIDVTVSSIANASSLRGGTLLMTPLRGADGQVYALAQGNLVVGGLGAEGSDGSRITINIKSVGRIPGGASVERSVPSSFAQTDSLMLNLHTPDFTTANRLAQSINDSFGLGTAAPIDATSVRIAAPADTAQRVTYVSMVENLTVDPGEAPARVIVNSRTGTVVIGNRVQLSPAAISHGSLVVTITERQDVSQPQPFGEGTTAVTQRSDVQVSEEGSRMFLFDPGVTLDELVRAVNQVGVAPGDLAAILEALKQAGALRAELIVI